MMNTINVFKNISLLNCVVGLTIFNPMPILAIVPNLSVVTNSSLSTKNALLAQVPEEGASCSVTNIQTGQLALRFTPGGKSRAGLNNGNRVQILKYGDAPWYYVKVLKGPNRAVNGLKGWVNSNYLSCDNS